MNALMTSPKYELPATFEDLSKFVLIGREKLVAVRAEIRAIDKVGLAKSVREQKLQEAQAISEAVLDAEVRIGQLMQKVPKADNGGANQYRGKTTAVSDKRNSKTEVIKDAGFTPKQAERFQQLASHPEIVEAAKAEARENDDIVSRSLVLNMIRNQKKADQIEHAKQDIVNQESKDEEAILYVGDGIGHVPGVPYDLLLTDPPYSTEVEYIESFARSWLPDALEYVKPTGSAYVFIGAYPEEQRA